MRVLLINWARIWDGATNGGGVNGYCQSLALELAARGHDVSYLFAGVTCTSPPMGGDAPEPACGVRRHPDWLGIRVFEVMNSPVLAPAAFQFRDPATEGQCPELARVVGGFVDLLAPDVVHFHNIEGLSADCVQAARGASRNRVVLYSIHNYHTMCPQVYLLRGYTTPCLDSDGGRACESCIDAPDPAAERVRRRREHAASVGFAPLTVSRGAAPEIESGVPDYQSRIAGVQSRAAVRPFEPPWPGAPCRDDEDVNRPHPFAGTDGRGQTAQILAERAARADADPTDPSRRAVRNEVSTEPRVDPADPGANRYGARRSRMIDALNSCDRVLAVSEYVRRRYVAAGVEAERIEVQSIGTRINRTVERLRDLVFDPPPFDPARPRPIRLVFMGYNNVYKGLPLLAETLELMTPEYLSRFHLYLFAQAGESIEWRFRRMEPRLGGLSVYHGYQHHDIPWMLGGKDLGVVPSIWWDNAPQTVFEFFACGVPVLGADIGGIPDFVRDGHNGLLFTANDRFDLARRLAAVARRPGDLERLRRNVRPPKDIADHAAELESVYGECLSSREAGLSVRDGHAAEAERIAAPRAETEGLGTPDPLATGRTAC